MKLLEPPLVVGVLFHDFLAFGVVFDEPSEESGIVYYLLYFKIFAGLPPTIA